MSWMTLLRVGERKTKGEEEEEEEEEEERLTTGEDKDAAMFGR